MLGCSVASPVLTKKKAMAKFLAVKVQSWPIGGSQLDGQRLRLGLFFKILLPYHHLRFEQGQRTFKPITSFSVFHFFFSSLTHFSAQYKNHACVLLFWGWRSLPDPSRKIRGNGLSALKCCYKGGKQNVLENAGCRSKTISLASVPSPRPSL